MIIIQCVIYQNWSVGLGTGWHDFTWFYIGKCTQCTFTHIGQNDSVWRYINTRVIFNITTNHCISVIIMDKSCDTFLRFRKKETKWKPVYLIVSYNGSRRAVVGAVNKYLCKTFIFVEQKWKITIKVLSSRLVSLVTLFGYERFFFLFQGEEFVMMSY